MQKSTAGAGYVSGRFRATRELLSFAWPKESNQRKSYPKRLIPKILINFGR